MCIYEAKKLLKYLSYAFHSSKSFYFGLLVSYTFSRPIPELVGLSPIIIIWLTKFAPYLLLKGQTGLLEIPVFLFPQIICTNDLRALKVETLKKKVE